MNDTERGWPRRHHPRSSATNKKSTIPPQVTPKALAVLVITGFIAVLVAAGANFFVKALPDPLAREALAVTVEWPDISIDGCTWNQYASMPDGGPHPTEIPWGQESLYQTVANAGGGTHDQGKVGIHLSARTDYVIQVLKIEPVIDKYSDEPPAWIIDTFHGACGDAEQRLFDWDMAKPGKPLLVERSNYGSSSQQGNAKPPLGKTFTVTEHQPYDIYVYLTNAPRGITEYSFDITYRVNGKIYSKKLRAADRFISISGGQPLHEYYIESDMTGYKVSTLQKVR